MKELYENNLNKKLTYFLLATFLIVGCIKKEKTEIAVIKVPSVKCDMCEETIKKAIFTNLEGIKDVSFNMEEKIVNIEYIPKQTNVETIELTIAKAGYDANDKKRDATAFENLQDCCKSH